MGEFDYNSSAGGFGFNPMMFGMMPGPQYNPLGSGNPSIDHAFATYGVPMLQQFLGGNKFLPQQFPAQGLLDQMAAAKYMRSSKANEHHARQHIDQQTIYENLVGIRSKFDAEPLSDTGKAQYKTAASYINSEAGQMAAGMLFGPQNAEDLFFGRKGSAVQLASAVNKIGYYRPDSVSGQDRMSEDSLKEFSNQLYSNLYGPDADLNDVSGFSAGRVGGIMTELARRGLLPESVSKLSAAGRTEALNEKGMDKLGLSEQLTNAIRGGSSLEEIEEKVPDGASGIRKIDATRVSNALKGYTDALSVVREIFGDNGITNAPMQQLMAAMEALTQGGTATMKAGAIENLMRRTQMASRDSGVSLEGLMGLSARAGALADQYGLSREVASENVVSSMERVRAMQDTGGFKPGFGRLDPTKAGMLALDQSTRADASRVGKYISAAGRLIAEGGEDGFKGTRMRAMVEALQRGDASFYDESAGRNVNIGEELGRNPDAFMRGMLQEAGVSAQHFSALARDPGTQEYLTKMAGGLAGAQAAELKKKIGLHAVNGTGLRAKLGKGMTTRDADALASHFGRGFSNAVIDNVDTTMNADDRINALEDAARQSFKDYARSKNPSASADEIERTADQMVNERFGDRAGLRAELSRQYAETGVMTEARGFGKLSTLQQSLNDRGINEFQRRHSVNKNRAGIMDNAQVGDQSNTLQRISDMMGAGGGGLEQALNIVDSLRDQEKLLEGIGGGKNNVALKNAFENLQKSYAEGTVNTKEERDELVKRATTDFAGVKDQFVGTSAEAAFENKTSYMTTAQLAANMERQYSKNENHFTALYKKHFKDMAPAAVDKLFKNADTRKKAMEELAGTAGVDEELAKLGINVAGPRVMTEANLRFLADSHDAYAVGADRAKIKALGALGREFNSGQIKAESILGSLSVDEKVIDDKKLTQSMQDYINSAKDGTIGAVGSRLGELGITGEKAAEIISTTQFARNLKELGGFSSLGTATFAERAEYAGRKEALDARVKSGEITGRVADAIKKREAGDKLDATEQKLVADAYKGDKETLEKHVDVSDKAKAEKGGGTKVGYMQDMEKEAKSITAKNTGAGSASDPSGIGTAVANAIGSLFKDVFKGEMKFDNVTIASVKVLSGIDQLAAKTEKDGGKVELSGSIKLEGLEAGVANLIAQSNSNDAPTPAGGTPVKDLPRSTRSVPA